MRNCPIKKIKKNDTKTGNRNWMYSQRRTKHIKVWWTFMLRLWELTAASSFFTGKLGDDGVPPPITIHRHTHTLWGILHKLTFISWSLTRTITTTCLTPTPTLVHMRKPLWKHIYVCFCQIYVYLCVMLECLWHEAWCWMKKTKRCHVSSVNDVRPAS